MIRFGINTQGVVLSNDIPDIIVFSNHECVDIRLSVNGNTVLAGRYYMFEGKAVVSDISSIVNDTLVKNSDEPLCAVRIEAFFGQDEAELTEYSFHVLYCNMNTGMNDSTDWLKLNFLTLSQYRRIAPEGIINVAWYSTATESVEFRVDVAFEYDSGQRSAYSYIESGDGQIANMTGIIAKSLYLSDIRKQVIKATKGFSEITLLAVTVSCNQRAATFCIDPALASVVPFYYLNCFGIVEQLPLQRVTTEKVKAEHSIATLGNTARFYDVTNSKEYEVLSAPLTSDECIQLQQLLTSPSVRIPTGLDAPLQEPDFDTLTPILITDFTSDFSDSDEELNTVKFTWRFADNRPKVALPNSPGVFNDSFQSTFS